MRHYKRCSCEIDLETMTKKDIIRFSQQRQLELSFMNKHVGYAQATFKDLAKTFEWLLKPLAHARGADGTQLSYVGQKNLIPKRDDDNPLSNYHSYDTEAAASVQILKDVNAVPNQGVISITQLEQNGPFCDSFCINLVTVWNILYEMFGQMPMWLRGR